MEKLLGRPKPFSYPRCAVPRKDKKHNENDKTKFSKNLNAAAEKIIVGWT